jgi:hypothetical protein
MFMAWRPFPTRSMRATDTLAPASRFSARLAARLAAVFGSLFNNFLHSRLAAALASSGAPPEAAQSPDALHKLPPELSAPIAAAYADCFQGVCQRPISPGWVQSAGRGDFGPRSVFRRVIGMPR